MIVKISREAEGDLADGFWFYETRKDGLGSEFRDSLKSEIRSLVDSGGTHATKYGYHRKVLQAISVLHLFQMGFGFGAYHRRSFSSTTW